MPDAVAEDLGYLDYRTNYVRGGVFRIVSHLRYQGPSVGPHMAFPRDPYLIINIYRIY